jgi:hypothetical protein
LRARGDLDELLVAALDRAVALEQVHHVAEAVAEDLRLDVLGVDDALFQEHFRRTEGLGGFGNHPGKFCSSSSRLLQRRMPRPPPPEVALSITG